MKSSIKIDFLDRGTGVGLEPVIRIELIKSEDPRDTLIAVLFESVSFHKYLQFHFSNNKPVATKDGLSGLEKTILLFKPSMTVLERTAAKLEFEGELKEVQDLIPDKKTRQAITDHHIKQFNERMAAYN